MTDNEKKLVIDLLERWHKAEKFYIMERSTDIENDLLSLHDKLDDLMEKFGL